MGTPGDTDVKIHVHLHNNSDDVLNQLKKEIHQMALDLQALKDAVAAEKTVEDSAVALLTGLTSKIADLIAASGNTVDPAELKAIVDQVNGDAAALAAAVSANTPVVPAV